MNWKPITCHREAAAWRRVALAGFACIGLLVGCGRVEPPVVVEQGEEAGQAGLAEAEPIPVASEGHRRLVERLAEIARGVPSEHPQLGDRKLEELRRVLAEHGEKMDDRRRCQLHTTLGIEELKLNHLREAIDQLELAHGLLGAIRFSSELDRKGSSNAVRMQLGMAYLRLGETENCCQQYTAESCIVPIRGTGIHTRQEGARGAIKYFSEVLNEPPLNSGNPFHYLKGPLAAKWLLNLAYMTIGEYPGGVPEAWLIPPSVFESEVEFPHFRNAGPDLGMDTFNLCGAVVVDDFDGDGDYDIVTSSWDPTAQTKYFRNDGNGEFKERTAAAGLTGMFGGLHMSQADYDNDGDLDLFVYRGAWGSAYGSHPNSLLRNDGRGVFEDVTYAAGLAEVDYPTQSGGWADYDNDGDVDLFVGNETSDHVRAPCQLFRNNGDGTFTDVAEQAGVQAYVFAKGVTWGDYDGDRYPDLFVSVAGAVNLLYHNEGDGTFTECAERAGVQFPRGSFPAWFWDYDNDGALDLWVGSSSGPIGLLSLYPEGVTTVSGDAEMRRLQEMLDVEVMALYRGDGRGGFENRAEAAGLDYPAQPMGSNFGDLNNDGYLDFYLGTGDVAYEEIRPNVMFLSQGGSRFANVTMAGGFGHLQKGHGVSFADIDNDGDSDVYIQIGGAYVGDRFNDALFENPGFANGSLAVKLEGRRSNRAAIGARIHLRFTENGVGRSVYRTVDSGSSFGCNPLRQTIGVGTATEVERMEIFWPTTGETEVFEDVAVNQAVRVVEGEGNYSRMELKAFRLPGEKLKD